jgi:hypothetical protein
MGGHVTYDPVHHHHGQARSPRREIVSGLPIGGVPSAALHAAAGAERALGYSGSIVGVGAAATAPPRPPAARHAGLRRHVTHTRHVTHVT